MEVFVAEAVSGIDSDGVQEEDASVSEALAVGVVLHESLEAVGFSPVHGGTVADTGQQDRWRVRPATITLLRSLASGSSIEDDESLDRANRLLACYARELLGDEPPAMRWAFPDLAPSARFPAS